LEQPLISLGLCKTRAEVKRIFDEVDEDGSGEIDFNEFLNVIKNATNASQDKREIMVFL